MPKDQFYKFKAQHDAAPEGMLFCIQCEEYHPVEEFGRNPAVGCRGRDYICKMSIYSNNQAKRMVNMDQDKLVKTLKKAAIQIEIGTEILSAQGFDVESLF